ncbi:hypothetical protein JCM8208_005577 [Rhodotorula glutinis]
MFSSLMPLSPTRTPVVHEPGHDKLERAPDADGLDGRVGLDGDGALVSLGASVGLGPFEVLEQDRNAMLVVT